LLDRGIRSVLTLDWIELAALLAALVRSKVILAGLVVLLILGWGQVQQGEVALLRGRPWLLAAGAGLVCFGVLRSAWPNDRALSGPLGFVLIDRRKALVTALLRALPVMALLLVIGIGATIGSVLSLGDVHWIVTGVGLGSVAGIGSSLLSKQQGRASYEPSRDHMTRVALLARTPIAMASLLGPFAVRAGVLGTAIGAVVAWLTKTDFIGLALIILVGALLTCIGATISVLVRLGRYRREGHMAVMVEALIALIFVASGLWWALPFWLCVRLVWLMRRAERVRWWGIT
jgi:hypothetical protein